LRCFALADRVGPPSSLVGDSGALPLAVVSGRNGHQVGPKLDQRTGRRYMLADKALALAKRRASSSAMAGPPLAVGAGTRNPLAPPLGLRWVKR